jgi:uncharacterized protein YaeQ
MAQGSTLYRFKIDLSDNERSVYETLDVRVAMHASESTDYLLTRVLAYALNFQDGLEFSTGLSTPEEPAIRVIAPNGTITKWIDIGNPSAKRLHKASKASPSVRVYTYKDPENLKREIQGETIHRAEKIEVFSLDPKFLSQIAEGLERHNSWAVIYDQGDLMVTVGESVWSSPLGQHRLV